MVSTLRQLGSLLDVQRLIDDLFDAGLLTLALPEDI